MSKLPFLRLIILNILKNNKILYKEIQTIYEKNKNLFKINSMPKK